MQINLNQLKSIIRHVIKENSTKHIREVNSPPRQPQKSMQLMIQGLNALNTAIELFHATEGNLELISELKDTFEFVKTLIPNSSPNPQSINSTDPLNALDLAIENFHKAMDKDPIKWERKPGQEEESTLLHHIITLERVYEAMDKITPNNVAAWGSLPGENHTPVDTGKYNPRHIDLHHPQR